MSGHRLVTSELIAAIRGGNLNAMIGALEAGADIEEADIHGHSGLPLRTACFSGNLAIVDELIGRGADINAAGSNGPGMPLQLAVRGKQHEVIALLLRHGAEIPPGLEIPPEALVSREERGEPGMLEAPHLDIPLLPREAASSEPTVFDIIENIDIPGHYGTDTNMLTMDLLRHNEAKEDAAKAAEAETPKETKSSFWKTGRLIK